MESIKMEQKSEILASKITEYNNFISCIKKYRSLDSIKPLVWITIIFNLNDGTSTHLIFFTEEDAMKNYEMIINER